jgi:biopolymer transport protein ExbD
MAHIESGGSGRKTSLELNLVPFIDLMSVLITFLLITAVWTQVSMIQIGSSIYSKKSGDQSVPLTPEMDKIVRVDIRQDGYWVIIGTEQKLIPRAGEAFDTIALAELMKKAKLLFPEKVDAMVGMDDKLAFDHLINGMDVILKAGFPKISVASGGI